MNDYCSYECRNNSLQADRRYGAKDAKFGPGNERIGVGWRIEGGLDGRRPLFLWLTIWFEIAVMDSRRR